MESVLGLVALWLVFGGTHVGLATRRVREALVSRLGEFGFGGLFTLVAAVSFSVLVWFYAAHRFDGPPGLALGAVPALRWPLMAIVVVGIAMMAASLVGYPSSPMAVFNHSVRPPWRMERVTRHAFFVGVAFGGAALAGVQSLRRVTRHHRAPDGTWLAFFFMLTAVAHALVGLAIFHDPLVAIARDGFVNGVEPQLLARGLPAYFDREAAFWFMLYAPVLLMVGLVTGRAIEKQDVVVLRLVGWTMLFTGGAGVVALPVSGFWILLGLGGL